MCGGVHMHMHTLAMSRETAQYGTGLRNVLLRTCKEAGFRNLFRRFYPEIRVF